MRQLKIIAIMIMYIYIFVAAINIKNYNAILFLVILSFHHFYNNEEVYRLKKTIKHTLCKQKDNFINILNHDLRIPIIAQTRALEIIKNETLGELNNSQKEIILQTEKSCRYVLNLTSLIINTYRIENNTYKLIYEKFNISDIIISSFNELISTAAEKNITFEYNGENKDVFITGDKSELKKVILNILTTLISASSTGDKLSVMLSIVKNKIRLTLSGNNSSFHTKIEDSYYSSVGHAIRLGFCKKIIETHQGKVIDTQKENCYSFEIPQFVTA